jgi:cell division protein ZapA
VGQVGDTRLLLMAALLIADEHHGKTDAADHHGGNAALRAELEAHAKAAEDRSVAALEQASARIESIAAELSAA